MSFAGSCQSSNEAAHSNPLFPVGHRSTYIRRQPGQLSPFLNTEFLSAFLSTREGGIDSQDHYPSLGEC